MSVSLLGDGGWRPETGSFLGSLAGKKKCNLKPAATVAQCADQWESHLTYNPEPSIWFDWLKKPRMTRTVALCVFSPFIKATVSVLPTWQVTINPPARSGYAVTWRQGHLWNCFQSFCTYRRHRKVFFNRLCFLLGFFFCPPLWAKTRGQGLILMHATPFPKQILSVNSDIFVYVQNLSGQPKLRTGQGDATSLLSLSSGGASDWLDQALVGGQRAAACLPPQLPYALLLFSTAITQLSYSPLFVMCQGPTREEGWGDSGEKLSLRSQSNIFWANTSLLSLHRPPELAHSAPRLWECSSEPRLRNRQKAHQPLASGSSKFPPCHICARITTHCNGNGGLKKKTRATPGRALRSEDGHGRLYVLP